ncbi:hypothetical protein V8F06_001648 [Rhypophila decipiens]
MYTYTAASWCLPIRTTNQKNRRNHSIWPTLQLPRTTIEMMSIIGTPFCAPRRLHCQYSAEPTLAPLFRLFNDMDMDTSYSAPQRHHAPQRHRYSAEPASLSLFQLLDDHFQDYSRDSVAHQPKRRRQSPASRPRFNPRFHIRETDDTYELSAELAGIEKENLNIQFTNPRIVQIRGRIERTQEEQQSASESEEEEQQEATGPAAAKPEKKSNKYQATVEDDTEDSWTEASSTGSWTPISSPKPEQAKPISTEEPKTSADIQKAASDTKHEASHKKEKNTGKVLLGEFSRNFEFPADVDQDGVSASMDNGQLTVIVPKKVPTWPRRILLV